MIIERIGDQIVVVRVMQFPAIVQFKDLLDMVQVSPDKAEVVYDPIEIKSDRCAGESDTLLRFKVATSLADSLKEYGVVVEGVIDPDNQVGYELVDAMAANGWKLKYGTHDPFVCLKGGFFAEFSQNEYFIDMWLSSGHALDLDDAIRMAAKLALGLPVKVPSSSEF